MGISENATRPCCTKPEVVLIDIDLHGTDAFEATRRIKTSLPATKVIMLSVLEGEAHRKAAAKYGADVFLLKTAEISAQKSRLAYGEAERRRLGREIVDFAGRVRSACPNTPVATDAPSGLA